MLFPEALTDLDQYRAFRQAVDIPILANMTEFGKTPLFDLPELAKAGVDMVLYPLTLNRIMNQAAVNALVTLREDGHQMGLVGRMQTREELYRVLGYHAYEAKLDALFGRDGEEAGEAAGQGVKSAKKKSAAAKAKRAGASAARGRARGKSKGKPRKGG
jgi:methylisocitrate lyase